MKICGYIHAFRCLEPCGGVGRHANSILARLARRSGCDVSLLLAGSYVSATGELPATLPLRSLPFRSFPWPEPVVEKLGRAIGWPRIDRWSPGCDWYYSPMETRLPVSRGRSAATVHDVQAFETDLPWSRSPAHLRMRRRWQWWLPRACRTLDRVLTVSEFSKGRMVHFLGVDPDRIVVVGNGVEETFLAAGRRTGGRNPRRPEIVVVGGLRVEKGAEWVFEVADLLRERRSPLKLVIVGPNDPAYRPRAAAHSHLELLGMIGDEPLAERLTNATALMLLSHYEGFGIPPLEAMACGTPAVVSDRGSLPEVVGAAGFVVPPERTGDVADLLASLRPGSADYLARVDAGLLRVRDFTWDRCVDRLLGVFTGG